MPNQKPTLNQADVKLLEKHFLTRKDSKNFATKGDLKGLATKDDLRAFATKDDLKAISKKIDRNTAKIRKDIMLYTGALDKDITSNRKKLKANSERIKRIEVGMLLSAA